MAKSFLRVISASSNEYKAQGAFDDILYDNPQRDSQKWSEDDA